MTGEGARLNFRLLGAAEVRYDGPDDYAIACGRRIAASPCSGTVVVRDLEDHADALDLVKCPRCDEPLARID